MSRRLRQDAVAIFTAGVESAHPGKVMAEALAQEAWQQPVEVIALGKAACSMMAAALVGLPPGLLHGEALAITDAGNAVEYPGARVMVAGHPLPDQAGLRAAEVVRERLQRAGTGTTLLTLISGGGSALLPAPVPGVSLDDKVAATGLLLACGARIDEINTVRKHLSTLKGGWMTALAFPAQVRSLILSDVPDDDPGVIGSGPTVPDPTTFADALAVIDRYQLADSMPATVVEYLRAGAVGLRPETPKPADPVFATARHRVIGGPGLALAGAARRAQALGYQVVGTPNPLAGEARLLGEAMAKRASSYPRPSALIWGGETTVTVGGRGRGGRNQELALAFALAATHLDQPWVLVAGGTDGRDGPTNAAGGVVNSGTIARIMAAGLDPRASLDDNDSHHALAAAGDLLITGPTGTNVADLAILLLG